MWLRNRNPAAPVLRRYDGSGGTTVPAVIPGGARILSCKGSITNPADSSIRQIAAYLGLSTGDPSGVRR